MTLYACIFALAVLVATVWLRRGTEAGATFYRTGPLAVRARLVGQGSAASHPPTLRQRLDRWLLNRQRRHFFIGAWARQATLVSVRLQRLRRLQRRTILDLRDMELSLGAQRSFWFHLKLQMQVAGVAVIGAILAVAMGKPLMSDAPPHDENANERIQGWMDSNAAYRCSLESPRSHAFKRPTVSPHIDQGWTGPAQNAQLPVSLQRSNYHTNIASTASPSSSPAVPNINITNAGHTNIVTGHTNTDIRPPQPTP